MAVAATDLDSPWATMSAAPAPAPAGVPYSQNMQRDVEAARKKFGRDPDPRQGGIKLLQSS